MNTKQIKNSLYSRMSLILAAVVAVVTMMSLVLVSVAQADDKAATDNMGSGSTQVYAADSPIEIGTIVTLDNKDSRKVSVATDKNLENMFGVVVDGSRLPFTIIDDSVTNPTYVAVSGTQKVLVSTQGGAIKPGDYVTMSALNGIAMKASTDEKTVFGRANAGFDGKGVILGKTTLKDETGKDNATVAIGQIAVSVNIQRNPNIKSTKADVPDFLERVGQAIAEKEVSPIRIYISVAITLISLVAAIIVVYSGVRSSIISIGRNPMSKKSIFRALLQIILTSLLILVIGLSSVYLLLKL